jgi:hypothetical protein
MNLSTARLAGCFFWVLGSLSGVSLLPPAARGQLRPEEITYQQSSGLPYRESGKITVNFGPDAYFGTATFVHRYTGLTAGHLLYDPKQGFATMPVFEQGLYNDYPPNQRLGFFAVLAGYQAAATVDPDSNAAFAVDMGYFLLTTPSPLDEWAAFDDDPSLLTVSNHFLAFGYAAETFSGNELASVQTDEPYSLELGSLLQTGAYYTQSGMSGGPVYFQENGAMVIGAVNVAGDDPPSPAESAARAITPDVSALLMDAEYVHGLITGAVLTGPTSVKAGSSQIYRSGLTFADGKTEGEGIPRRYSEIELIPEGSAKHSVTVTTFKTERYMVKFAASLRPGTQVVLRLFRNNLAPTTQTPLRTLTVTVQ